MRAKVYVPIGYRGYGDYDVADSMKASAQPSSFWSLVRLNLSILCIFGAGLTGALAVLCAMATDTSDMINSLLHERWELESDVPKWVGEIGGIHGLLEEETTDDFFRSVLRGDSHVRDSWWYNFIDGFLRDHDLDWGYWAFNGDRMVEDKTTSMYYESKEGLSTVDYSAARSRPQMESLARLMGAPASIETKVPLSASAGWIVDMNRDRVKLSCVNWYGGHQAKFAPGGLNQQPLSSLASLIASMGFNCVRLTFSLELVLTNPVVDSQEFGEHNPTLVGKRALEVFDATITELSRVGVMTILNNHNSESGWCCDVNSVEGMWDTPAYPVQRWIDAWELLARRYANDPFVIGADLRNEIHDAGGRVITWGSSDDASTDWKAAVELVSIEIGNYAPDWLIIVSGMCFTFDLRLQERALPSLPRMDKLVWTVHFYPMSMWWRHLESEMVVMGYLIRAICIAIFTGLLWTSCSYKIERWQNRLLWCATACALIAIFAVIMEINFVILTVALVSLCAMFVSLSAVTVARAIEMSHSYQCLDYGLTVAMWGVVTGVVLLIVDMLFKIAYSQVGCMSVYTTFYDYSPTAYITLTTASLFTLLFGVMRATH